MNNSRQGANTALAYAGHRSPINKHVKLYVAFSIVYLLVLFVYLIVVGIMELFISYSNALMLYYLLGALQAVVLIFEAILQVLGHLVCGVYSPVYFVVKRDMDCVHWLFVACLGAFCIADFSTIIAYSDCRGEDPGIEINNCEYITEGAGLIPFAVIGFIEALIALIFKIILFRRVSVMRVRRQNCRYEYNVDTYTGTVPAVRGYRGLRKDKYIARLHAYEIFKLERENTALFTQMNAETNDRDPYNADMLAADAMQSRQGMSAAMQRIESLKAEIRRLQEQEASVQREIRTERAKRGER